MSHTHAFCFIRRFAFLAVAGYMLMMTSGCAVPAAEWKESLAFTNNNSEACHQNTDGSQICGYDCELGSDGFHKCAKTSRGGCKVAASGEVVCWEPKPEVKEQPKETRAEPVAQEDGFFQQSAADEPSQETANCCVNGAYYDCPGAVDVAICIGKPRRLMSCMQSCGFGGNCPQECIDDYGPKPQDSQCVRDPSMDSSCERR